MKFIYNGNIGVVVDEEQELILKDYFTSDKPEDTKKYKIIHVNTALSMVNESKEEIKEDSEDDKPKRKRRTKEEMEADKKD